MARSVVVAAHVYLKAQKVVNPEWQAELLVGGILEMPRHEIYLNADRHVSGGEMARIRDALTRRAGGEPTQYILGKTEFFELPFKCDKRALIPRPETELVTDVALGFLLKPVVEAPRVLDLGTGSGCIAVALAVNLPGAHVIATDVSADALALAAENAELNGVADRIEFVESDLFGSVSGEFDLIVANLPYVAEADRATLMPEVRDWEPEGALFSGETGLNLVERAIGEAPGYLKSGGGLVMEIGFDQAERVLEIAAGVPELGESRVLKDYEGHLRILTAKKN